MHKKKGALLLALVLIFGGTLPAYGAAPAQEVTQPPILEEEEVPKEEPRDQNYLVPTSKGVQQATKTEFDLIQQLSQESNEALLGAYLIGDYTSGKILSAYNIDQVVGIASLTKIMTIYVALDAVANGEISLDDSVVMDHESVMMQRGQFKLKEGKAYTVKQLMDYGLIVSANDAMMALAKHVSGTEPAFVARMNAKAQALGLTHAHFINAHGLTNYEINDYNQMTTREIFLLAQSFIKEYPLMIEVTSQPLSVGENDHVGFNTNPLLGIVDHVDGLKTGYTGAAGHCLVATSYLPQVENRQETRLIGVFMGAQNPWKRYVAARRLMEDANNRYAYTTIVGPDDVIETLHLENVSPTVISLYPREGKTALIDHTKDIEVHTELYPFTAPVEEGTALGKVTYSVEGEEIYQTDLVARSKIKNPNYLLRLKDFIHEGFLYIDQITHPPVDEREK